MTIDVLHFVHRGLNHTMMHWQSGLSARRVTWVPQAQASRTGASLCQQISVTPEQTRSSRYCSSSIFPSCLYVSAHFHSPRTDQQLQVLPDQQFCQLLACVSRFLQSSNRPGSSSTAPPKLEQRHKTCKHLLGSLN